ncbi:MAG TPA: hypothetical protein VEX40_18215 [Mycobacterium sp.]|nr:hypothetical protein [Mycobacterium sp.]
MLVHTIRTNGTRLIAGAFAAAAVAVPLYASLTSTDAAPQVTAGPACLAWFGNKEDGNCMGYSNGSPVFVGTPQIGLNGGGIGFGIPFETGPLLPGTTITRDFG